MYQLKQLDKEAKLALIPKLEEIAKTSDYSEIDFKKIPHVFVAYRVLGIHPRM